MTSDVSDEVASAINSQLNTSQVKQFTSMISIAKTVDHAVALISAIGLGIMILVAVLRKYFIRSFSWVGLWSSLITYVLILGLGALINQIGSNYPDFSRSPSEIQGHRLFKTPPTIRQPNKITVNIRRTNQEPIAWE